LPALVTRINRATPKLFAMPLVLIRGPLDQMYAHFGARSVAIATAALFFGSYFVWLLAFERWFEPMLRRWAGSIARRAIVWVPDGRGFRTWGLRDRAAAAADAAIALVGAGLVLGSALLPVVLLGRVASAHTADPRIAASSYLICVPLMALFVFRVLSAKHEGRDVHARTPP